MFYRPPEDFFLTFYVLIENNHVGIGIIFVFRIKLFTISINIWLSFQNNTLNATQQANEETRILHLIHFSMVALQLRGYLCCYEQLMIQERYFFDISERYFFVEHIWK